MAPPKMLYSQETLKHSLLPVKPLLPKRVLPYVVPYIVPYPHCLLAYSFLCAQESIGIQHPGELPLQGVSHFHARSSQEEERSIAHR